jgi:hypothetical protein
MAAVLGVILALPPIKQALASRQMKSRYLEALLQRRASQRGTEAEAEVRAGSRQGHV